MAAVALECTFTELDAVGEALGLTLRRFPFTFPYYGNGIDRTALRTQVGASLAARGLLCDNRFAPELRDTLTLFATGEPAIGLFGTAADAQLTALGVLGCEHGLVATAHDEGIRFVFMPHGEVVPTLVALLPPMPGAPDGAPPASRLGGGSFVVDGRPIGWVDAEQGRYLAITTRGSDGRPRIHYSPGDRETVECQLRAAISLG
ncbi:ESX secretion-associated protein EspG [Kutzneria chonburiensis]|uniref:ESX secretion-associated protein EspG n=1 Tax=Kutzneria chonburiensis TaxID=1483604 RepID=A0ABV6MIM2_9PSEU|nr:ESX secretion-associated protein EspG [Kutzneria chonburiensis]